MPQQVLVFETEILRKLGAFQGYSLDVDAYLPTLLDPGNNRFMDRQAAEQDPRYKQIIPYVVLRFGDSVFSYVRGRLSGEARLRQCRSIGLGGHIEPGDRSLFSSDRHLYLEAARREVHEEVALNTAYTEHLVALINDDSNDVGKVHFGIVHIWDLVDDAVSKREGLITQAGFLSLDRLKGRADELETWSKIALQVLEDPRVPRYETHPDRSAGSRRCVADTDSLASRPPLPPQHPE